MSLPIDHLVWGAPDLDAGSATIAELCGVAPAAGGSHPGFGTRNALLGLGRDIYLEIIAPDAGTVPPGSLGERLGQLSEPGLVTWVARSPGLADIAAAASQAAAHMTAIGPLPAQRETPTGEMLNWELLFLTGHIFDGLVPFFIDWQGSPHPSASAPAGGTFAGLELQSPDPGTLRGALSALGLNQTISAADQPGIAVDIDTANGPVRLRSTPETVELEFA